MQISVRTALKLPGNPYFNAMVFFCVIGLFWRSPILLFFILASLTFSVSLISWSRKFRILFLAGLTLGGFGELLFTSARFQFWLYHPESLTQPLSIPIWVPTLWGYAVVIAVKIHEWLSHQTNLSPGKSGIFKWAFLFVLAVYLGFLFLRIQPGILTVYLLGLALLRIWKVDPGQARLFLVAAFIGVVGESVAIYLGIWEYRQRNFLLRIGSNPINIPYSLPLAWGIATLMMLRVSTLIDQKISASRD